MIHKVRFDSISVTIWPDSNSSVRRSEEDVRGNLPPEDQNDKVKLAGEIQKELQEALEDWNPLSRLPGSIVVRGTVSRGSTLRSGYTVRGENDPDKNIDPGRSDLFWQTKAGIEYLVSRSILVTVTWDGAAYFPAIKSV